MEPLVVVGQADVLPDCLRIEALTEMKLAICDQSEVVPAPEDVPGEDVKLADDGGQGRGALDVGLVDAELRGNFL